MLLARCKQLRDAPMIKHGAATLEEAARIQLEVAKVVVKEDGPLATIRAACGVDVSYVGEVATAAAVVQDARGFKVLDAKRAMVRVRHPYRATFLFLREAEPILEALSLLTQDYDMLLVDGNGLLHPRRCGLACHVGVALERPTIGVAKGLLCGSVGPSAGDWRPVLHEGEVVGAALYSGRGSRPIYVSVGHRVSLETAVRIVRGASRGHRFPEPLRMAHLMSKGVWRGAGPGTSPA